MSRLSSFVAVSDTLLGCRTGGAVRSSSLSSTWRILSDSRRGLPRASTWPSTDTPRGRAPGVVGGLPMGAWLPSSITLSGGDVTLRPLGRVYTRGCSAPFSELSPRTMCFPGPARAWKSAGSNASDSIDAKLATREARCELWPEGWELWAEDSEAMGIPLRWGGAPGEEMGRAAWGVRRVAWGQAYMGVATVRRGGALEVGMLSRDSISKS